MTYLPQSETPRRAPRLWLADITPAVLRLHDGRRASGRLQVVSITGGLLALTRPLDRGARVRLMFLTSRGAVLGTAEMLNPVSYGRQPFRFVGLEEADRVKLSATIRPTLKPEIAPPAGPPGTHARGQPPPARNSDDEWIEKYRATLDRRYPQRTLSLTAMLRRFRPES